MAAHDIVVVGASAGGVEALITLAQGLPADLRAALFVVLHVPPEGRSHLPTILTRKGSLPAAHAVQGEAIRPGRIYVAPPDLHLLVRDGYVELSHGPRENHSRPAIDPLFRSAARAYGPRVVGVVLSGALGDGAMGLLAITARGGVTIVQDPDEALVDSMPRTALRYTPVDHILPAARIPDLLARLADEAVVEKGWQSMSETDATPPASDADVVAETPPQIPRDIAAQAHNERGGETSIYTCPECGGTMWQINRNGLMQFNCHVGHVYSPEHLLGQKAEEIEAALWACVRMLVEKATLRRQLAERMRVSGLEAQAARIEEEAQLDDHHGQIIRDNLLGTPFTPIVPAVVADEEPRDAAGA